MAPMKPVNAVVKNIFAQALRNSFPSVQQEVLLVKANPKFGDYQVNNAMGLFKDHGKALGFATPGAVAEAIKDGLPQNEVFSSITVAPQGFVTVKLSEAWITQQCYECIINDVEYTDAPRKRAVVDFSSPNIAKEMHVGHLRSTIIGESMCRILEFCGHEVHRLNHVGDWGTQFGMLIEYMKEVFPNFMTQLPDIGDLQEFYKASKKRFDEDEEFKKKAQLSVVDLQSGGEFARKAWQKICDVSRVAFQKIYDRLDVHLEERGESFYNEMIPHIVEDLKARELCVESSGAMCVFTPKVAEIPLMAVKSDGGYGYDSTDLAAVYHRLFMMRADWVVYITDMGQESHFHMIFDAARQAGWHVEGITRCDHMGFGVVQGDDKKKFKTRSGETVKLVDLLDEAVDRAATEIRKRVEQQSADGHEAFLKDEKEQREAANKIGIAAVRYFDMKQNRVSPYVFNYDKMLDPKGNTAVYLFYAYARIRAIQRKAGVDAKGMPKDMDNKEKGAEPKAKAAKTSGASDSFLQTEELGAEMLLYRRSPAAYRAQWGMSGGSSSGGAASVGGLTLGDEVERDLALKVVQFPDVIEAILANLHIHQLADYLWELCTLLTTFYTKCRVLDVPEQNSRLLLLEATRKVLYKSFFLLGFEPLERI